MKIDLPKTASVNGVLENEFYTIREGDQIQIQNFYTVEEIAEFMDVPLGGKILVNDTPAMPGTRVYENFTLDWDVQEEPSYEELEEEDYSMEERTGTADRPEPEEGTTGKPEPEEGPADRPGTGEESPSSSLPVMVNGDTVILTGKADYIFVDIFSFIEFDLRDPAGRDIVTKLNGRPAGYMESLKAGDVIEIYWKNRNENM